MDSPSQQQRIVVGVSGSLNSLVALQRASTEARLTGRRLLAVLVWRDSDIDLSHEANPSPLTGTRTEAMGLLRATLEDVFVDTDDTTPVSGLVISGSAGRTLVRIANRENDLLVIGGRHPSMLSPWRSPVARYCLTHATCPVLTIPPPPLQIELEALTRKRRLLSPRANDPFDMLYQPGIRRPA